MVRTRQDAADLKERRRMEAVRRSFNSKAPSISARKRRQIESDDFIETLIWEARD